MFNRGCDSYLDKMELCGSDPLAILYPLNRELFAENWTGLALARNWYPGDTTYSVLAKFSARGELDAGNRPN
jgi:hypothetical protein